MYQSLSYIKENNIEGDIVETGVFKGANLVLINDFLNKFDIDKKFMHMTHSKDNETLKFRF